MRFLLPLLILSACLFGPLAQAADWGQSFDSIRQAAAGVRSVQARFTQSKELKILKKPLISSGSFLFSAPARIRWAYEAPIESVLLMKDGKLSKYVKRDGAFVADAAERVETMRVVVEEIQGWLMGRFDQSQTFQPTLVPGASAGEATRVILTPKDAGLKSFIQRIELTLGARPGVLAQVKIVESERAITTLTFDQVALNRTLSDDAFAAPK